MINESLFKKITGRIESYEREMIDLQFGLTAIPALSPDNGGDGEYEKACYLKGKLCDLGFQMISEINAPDNRVSSGLRPNVITRIPGRIMGKASWIMTHMDIVPPGERSLWHDDPYRGYVKDGKIYGRGTEDNQQDMVASIFAAKAFIDEGIMPERPIGLAFVSDEETASHWGISYILQHPHNPFRREDLIVVPDSGNEDGTLIEVAEKSILWLRFRTTGRQCHGSRPDAGINAFQAASHLVVRLNDLHIRFPEADQFFTPPASTFQPTRKEANVPNVNTIPGDDVFFMDCRILPQYDLSEVLAEVLDMTHEIEKHFGVSIDISSVQQVQAPPATPHNAVVVSALQEAVWDVYHLKATPQGIGAGTVAAYFRREDYPVAVWSRSLQKAHQPDEHCLVSDMIGNAKVFAHLFLQP